MTKQISIRQDLDEYLDEMTINEITEFEGWLDKNHFSARVVSGGFGNAHVILTIFHDGTEIELGMMESEDYEQDGSDPLQIDGWKWREGGNSMLTTGWSSEMFNSARSALAAAITELPTE